MVALATWLHGRQVEKDMRLDAVQKHGYAMQHTSNCDHWQYVQGQMKVQEQALWGTSTL
jgi:hypothetical protein